MEKTIKKALLFYLKNSDDKNIILSEKEFLANFISSYFKIITNFHVTEEMYVQSNDFDELSQLNSLSFYLAKDNKKKENFNVSYKKGKFIFTSKIRSFDNKNTGKRLTLVFNEDNTLFFRIKSKKVLMLGLVDDKKESISAYYEKGSYKHWFSMQRNKINSYKYENDIKIEETENFYNELIKSYRTLVFDLMTKSPIEARVSFFNREYKLMQEIGSDPVININKEKEKRSNIENKISEIIDFVIENKGNFISSINEDDRIMFDMYFPTEDGKIFEIPF